MMSISTSTFERNDNLVPLSTLGNNRNFLLIDFSIVVFLGCISRITIFPSLNTVAWLIMDLVVVIIVLKNVEQYLQIFRANLLLLSWSLLAILSSLWSLNPDLSFYHGLQFGLNAFCGMVVAVSLGLVRFVAILRLFGLIFTSLSLVYDTVNPNVARDIAGFFRGVYLHKNELGMFSVLQLIICCLLFFQGSSRFLSVIGYLIAGVTLVKSGSGTSLLVFIFIMMFIPILFLFRQGIFPASQIIGFGLAVFFGGLLFLLTNRLDPIDYILASLGKDAGLTGRDLIWAIGLDAVASRPLLGHGFLAYWSSPESTASYLRFVLKQDLLSLHNVYLEVTVGFGILGLVFFLSSMLQQLLRGLIYFREEQQIISLMPFIYFVWILIICLSENPIFWNSQLNFILMAFAALCVQREGISSKHRRIVCLRAAK